MEENIFADDDEDDRMYNEIRHIQAILAQLISEIKRIRKIIPLLEKSIEDSKKGLGAIHLLEKGCHDREIRLIKLEGQLEVLIHSNRINITAIGARHSETTVEGNVGNNVTAGNGNNVGDM